MAVEADPHQVERLALVPVGGRPDGDDARDGLPVLEPDLDADDRRSGADRQQVVVDREARRLRLRSPGEALRAQRVDATARGGRVVAGDPSLAPAEVVDGRDVGEEVEAFLVTEVGTRLDESRGVDDERRLAVSVLALDEARDAFEGQLATPRISYAGGTPALIFSWRRTMPSSSASGRGGQPGTWTSTGRILSTPCRIA
jgi:hypothetical protein